GALAAAVAAAGGLAPDAARAASSPQAASPDGTCVGCLGVVDGLFEKCRGDLRGCVSSQDDRGEVFQVPWQLPVEGLKAGAAADKIAALRQVREGAVLAGGRVVKQEDRYLRVEFPVEVPLLGPDVDDAEWYFPLDDGIVHFRAERRSGRADFGENARRLEGIREQLGWDPLPVVRNRRRALVFMESPLDDLGPSLFDALRWDRDPQPYEEEVLKMQQDPTRRKQIFNGFMANGGHRRGDDLGYENADGQLDAATREYLRKKCDRNTQLC
ncbi:unnamed protein product, partial [Prorocentrum cordatum]